MNLRDGYTWVVPKVYFPIMWKIKKMLYKFWKNYILFLLGTSFSHLVAKKIRAFNVPRD